MVVFKQSFKPVNEKNTRTRNVAHLNYIAMRPGTVKNEGCGFGLFGKLQYMPEQASMNSLKHARGVISEASRKHTIYRAMLSLDHDTALAKGYYKRKSWEELVKTHIGVFAKEMGIEHNDFCYMASMHYKKGHPHVHLCYWDNSARVRAEYMPKGKFAITAEHIRAEFGRDIFKKEITEELNAKKEQSALARAEVLGTVRELNHEEILDVQRLKPADIKTLEPAFTEVLEALLKDKNRRYQYLNSDTKHTINVFTAEILKLPQYKPLVREYFKATTEVSKYYGNGKDKKAYNKEKASEELKKEIGNELLKYLKESDALDKFARRSMLGKQQLMDNIKAHITSSDEDAALYNGLLDMMPRERTPFSEIATPEFNDKVHKLAIKLIRDDGIAADVRKYCRGSSASARSDEQTPETAASNGKTDEKAFYGDIYKSTRSEIFNMLYKDSGYASDFKDTMLVNALVHMFEEVGRTKNHMRMQALSRSHASELSEAAKKDLRVKLKQSENSVEM